MPKSDQRDFIDWDAGREGYISTASAAKVYPAYSHSKPGGKPAAAQTGLFSIRAEERFGSLIGAAGIIWGVYLATQNYVGLWHFDITSPGPLEVCALGILAWLHAKWRRSLKSG